MAMQAPTQSFSPNGHRTEPVLSGVGNTLSLGDPSPEPFQALGFRFVRFFLLIILMVVGSMVGVIGYLGWHLGMDVTIEGQGQVEPTMRYDVKAQRSGLIQQVLVRQGQAVTKGDLMMALDDTDLQSELAQLESELLMNESRRVALSAELKREWAVLEVEVTRAQVVYEMARLQLEQVQKEYGVYHKYVPYRLDGSVRPAVDTLMPVRLQHTRVQQTQVDIERARRRLGALDSRKQELKSLKQMHEKLLVNRRLLQVHLESMKVYAPVSGVVLTRDLDKRVGDRLQAGDAVIELAKLNGWRAKVMIQEVDVPKVKVGQAVKLYVHAFPHMEYKVFEGVVTDVPKKPEILASGVGMVGTVYPVKVQIDDPQVIDGENVYSLAYGMGVDAKIVTERGAIVDLVWKKFLKTVGKIDYPEVYQLDHVSENSVN